MKTLLNNKVLALLCLILSICLVSTTISAQKKTTGKNKYTAISLEDFSKELLQQQLLNNHYHLLAHFEQSLNSEDIKSINDKGIKLLAYHNDNIYAVAVPQHIAKKTIQSSGIKRLVIPYFQLKTSRYLQANDIPAHALKSGNRVDLAITFYANTSLNDQRQIIKKLNGKTIEKSLRGGRLLLANLPIDQIESIVLHPAVSFVDIIEADPIKINYENRAVQGVSYLASSLNGGRNLKGDGVTIGIGDGGELGDHLDLNGRTINHAAGNYASFGTHGDHVAGTVGGAGIIDPRHTGMAPNSRLVIQKTSRITTYADDYFEDHGMTITNNSYGSSSDCIDYPFGEYNNTSGSLDKQLYDYPEILHVFAAGNSGGAQCNGLPKGYGTILRAYSSSKNILTVGAVDVNHDLGGFSSCGPVEDGRLKPEIMGVGVNVASTGGSYNYNNMSGTSMASPSVTGTLALVTQRYKSFNSNRNPSSAMLKAIACNTATDGGNIGPDYQYGFGVINGKRAIEAVENGWYSQGNVNEGQKKTHLLSVPNGIRQLKIMIAWTDIDSDAYPNRALVNNLDIEVKAPNGNIIKPWILNPSAVTDLAKRGTDNLNNIEQVTIDNPQSGTYEIYVNGFILPTPTAKNQDYALSYDLVKPEVVLTYPIGGGTLEANKAEIITWDAPSNDDRTFKVEYSTNQGGTWTILSSTIPAHRRSYQWTSPVAGKRVFVRVSRMGTNYTSTNKDPITTLDRPVASIKMLCGNEVQVDWAVSPSAESYNVYRFDGSKMVFEANTSNNYYVTKVNSGTEYWFAVSGITLTGKEGQRSTAKSIQAIENECISTVDLELVSAFFQKSGRQYTSTALSANEDIIINIKNNSEASISSFNANYSINGETFEEIVTSPIEAGATLKYTFETKANFSTPGEYIVETWVEASGETAINNNRLAATSVKQLSNTPVEFPLNMLFAGMQNGTYNQSMLGVGNTTMVDFINFSNGQIDISDEGKEKVVSLNSVSTSFSMNTALIYTLNLSDYLESRVLITFDYKIINNQAEGTSGQSNSDVSLWARGTDKDEWIKIKELSASNTWLTEKGLDTSSPPVEIAQQRLSSSFQFKFVVDGHNDIEIKNMGVEDGGTLPVELTYFKANKISETGVLLRWETASELNNDYFEVQVAKGKEAVQQGQFKTIDEVNGNGTTAEIQNYSYTHLEDNRFGEYYYRLKQVDFDGAFEYSDIRSIRFDKNVKSYTVYPSIVKGNSISLDLDVKQTSPAQIDLVDLNGKPIKTYERQITKGAQTLQLQLPTELETGNYYLITRIGQNVITRKIMKIRS